MNSIPKLANAYRQAICCGVAAFYPGLIGNVKKMVPCSKAMASSVTEGCAHAIEHRFRKFRNCFPLAEFGEPPVPLRLLGGGGDPTEFTEIVGAHLGAPTKIKGDIVGDLEDLSGRAQNVITGIEGMCREVL